MDELKISRIINITSKFRGATELRQFDQVLKQSLGKKLFGRCFFVHLSKKDLSFCTPACFLVLSFQFFSGVSLRLLEISGNHRPS